MTSQPTTSRGTSTSSTGPETERPGTLGDNGPAAAALLAAGFGVFALGLLTTLSEAFTGVHDWLQFVDRVGPLSGKTTMAGVGWLGVWAGLGVLWGKRALPILAVAAATLLLVVIGNLLMFPPIFQATA